MANFPTTQEPKTAKPPQFSLLTLMLWVAISGLYFAVMRWVMISPEFIEDRELFVVTVLIIIGSTLFSLAIFIYYYYWITPRKDSEGAIGVPGLCIGLGGMHLLTWAYTEGPELHTPLTYLFITTLATIITISHCKKQTGSWFPWVGERPEGESNE